MKGPDFMQLKKGLLGLLLGCCAVQPLSAAVVDCQFAGQNRVYADSNGNHQPDAADAYWSFHFDDVASVVIVDGHGVFPDKSVWDEAYLFRFTSGGTNVFHELIGYSGSTTDSWHLFHQELLIDARFSNTASASAPFNQLVVDWVNDNHNQNAEFPALYWDAGDNAFSLTLVDGNSDGIYDRVQGVVNTTMAWFPNAVVDEPIEYYPSLNDRQFLVIRQLARVYIKEPTPPYWPPSYTTLDIFFPVDGDRLEMSCGGQSLISVSRSTTGASQTPAVAVPILHPWALAALTLMLAAVGAWIMRRAGLGESLRQGGRF